MTEPTPTVPETTVVTDEVRAEIERLFALTEDELMLELGAHVMALPEAQREELLGKIEPEA